MRLAVNIGYVTGSNPAEQLELTREADRLGYSVAWAAEAYGSDAPTVLAYLAGQTEQIDLGAAVMQIPARSPAMTAMTAATLDLLSEGRFRLGLGVSGPQVSEGWHGVRFDRPLGRTREYVDIVRKALARETLTYDGKHFTLPLPDGPGKPLKLMLRPQEEPAARAGHRGRQRVPLYLAAVGPKNLELAGEVADGWLAIFFAPEHATDLLGHVDTGRLKAGATREGFDVVANVPVVFGEDPRACADPLRGYTALYVGGMGSREQNFYNRLARRMGFEDAAQRIQDLYLDRRHREAMAAVPFELVDQTALLGPEDRVAERLHAYAEAGVTTVSVSCVDGDLEQRKQTLRKMAAVLDRSGLGTG